MRIGNEIILMRDDAKIGDVVAAQPPRQNTAQNGVINKEDQGVLLAGYSYMLANIDTKDNVRGFELDMHRNLVKIGQQGRERSINHDHEAAKDAVLALADNDQRIAKALMTVANQSLGHSLCAAMSATGYKSLNAAIQPGNVGDYHISRLPDAPGGAKVFRVGWTVADRMGKSNNGELFTLGGGSLWAAPDSRVEGEIWMDLTCHPNGMIEPAFHGDPSYRLTYIAGQPQPPEQPINLNAPQNPVPQQ